MPFQSQKQRAFLFATHPRVAKSFQSQTPPHAKLPMYSNLTARLNGPKPINPVIPPHENMPSGLADEEKKVRF